MVLQHRGQDAAGMVAHEPATGRFHLHKAHGLITEALTEEALRTFRGSVALAHTRYATTALKAERSLLDLQPQFVNYPDGIALAHNGNVVNTAELTDWLATECRRHLSSNNDAEILLNLLAEQLGRDGESGDPLTRLARATKFTMERAQGGYAVVGVWGGQGLFAFRDEHGLRPLVLGRREENGQESWMLASESSALRFLDYTPVRDVAPGELLFIRPGHAPESLMLKQGKTAQCFFEWIYFSSPESVPAGQSVYRARLALGEKLAGKVSTLMQEGRIAPDVVVPVPDTSRPAAIALAEQLGVPYRELLIKNRYVQRSFILPNQERRERAVQLKLSVVGEEIKGKRVLLVDDSIVRGTTSRRLIKLLKEAGAAEVYLASTCPPITHPCYFGIDFPQRSELVASSHGPEELATLLGAEAVVYQERADLRAAIAQPLCEGCLSGEYPFDVSASAACFQRAREEAQKGVTC